MTSKPVIALHLGVHKTATTYIQSRLLGSVAALRHEGIAYIPTETLRPLVSRTLSASTFNPDEFRQLLSDHGTGCRRIILSDENILGDKAPRANHIYPDAKQRLQRLLDALTGYQVEAFITLRSYPDYLVSRYVEYLRHWDFMSFDEFYRALNLATVSWHDLIDDIRATGINRLHVRDYTTEFTDERPFFDQLLGTPGFPLERAQESPAVRRARISQQGFEVVQFFAKHYSRRGARKVLDLVDTVSQETAATPFMPLQEHVRVHLDTRYQAELAQLSTMHDTNMVEAIKHKFIFVAGMHRSGTSLLHQILRGHPRISGFSNTGVPQDEGQHLQSVYKSGKEFGGPGRFAFYPEAYMDESHALATASNAERLFTQWSAYYDLSRDYLVEKSPPNLIRTRFLQQLFPDSRFVVLLRHPIAIAYATRKWSKTPIASLIDHTLRAFEIFAHDHRHLRCVRVVRYEEFVGDPKKALDDIFDWIGIEPIAVTHEIDSQVNQAYFAQWRNEQMTAAAIPASELEQLELRANRFGYSLLDIDTLLPVMAFEIPPTGR